MQYSQEEVKQIIDDIQQRYPHIAMFTMLGQGECVWISMQLFKSDPASIEIPEAFLRAFEDKLGKERADG